jgi:hypothetical protein
MGELGITPGSPIGLRCACTPPRYSQPAQSCAPPPSFQREEIMPTSTATSTIYDLIITNDGELVANSSHTSVHERRDAAVDALKGACSDVEEDEVTEILETFGGADADSALDQIKELYADYGYDVYLEEKSTPPARLITLGLPTLHSVFVGHAKSSDNTISHFSTTEDRTEHLRQRLINLNAGVPASHTEDDLVIELQHTLRDLIDDHISVHLISTLQPSWTV